jgi:hypothetical protein
MFPGRKEKAMGTWKIAVPLKCKVPAAPTDARRFNAYVIVRTSQDCGSSTAQSPQKSGLFRGAGLVKQSDDFVKIAVDNADWAGL